MTTTKRITYTLLLAVTFIGTNASAQDNSSLSLDDQPPGSGGPPPNVLVAVDNSASMDSELLFPTLNGTLYWQRAGSSRYRFTKSNGTFYSDQGDFYNYSYLFPNGCNDDGYRDRRVYCANGGNFDNAAPPVEQLGFTRSARYNKAYFDPTVTYRPWIGYPNADPQAALSDPAIGTTSMNLTNDISSSKNNERFLVGPGIYIDANLPIYIDGRWQSYNRPVTFQNYTEIGIKYFPATFFLPAGQALPDNYSRYNGSVFGGKGPNGEPMRSYQIRPSNFSDDAEGRRQYRAAIQNFANWYSYYRKRSLAIRGAVTTAFDRLPKVRVAACSINEADSRASAGNFQAMTMRSLESASAREAFRKSIYNIDFHSPLGTPNRPALYDLGKELENNKSIIQSACQRNYGILFTDGFNSGQVNDIGDRDSDGYRNAMSDIAMRFYSDLNAPAPYDTQRGQLALPAGCPDASLDCNPNLHMTTFGVTVGLNGPIFGNTTAYPQANRQPYQYPPPWYVDDNLQKIPSGGMPVGGAFEIDDLWHATLDTHGQLLNAESPEELTDRFTQTLTDILARESTLTNASASSRNFSLGTDVYQTSYAPSNWTGNLVAYDAVNGDATPNGREWSAADQLTGFTNPAQDTRLVVTDLRRTDSDSGGQVDSVRFAADPVSYTREFPGLDPTTIFYLRGYRGDEQSNGGNMRNRGNPVNNTVLGDIVHSVPTYVGAPNPALYAGRFQDARHPELTAPENNGLYYNPAAGRGFAVDNAARTPMIYVGANDGMLHGFDANTGDEKLAFVPNAVLNGIGAPDTGLQSSQYVHQYFVDGQSTSGAVFVGGQWRTMLVGGLRSGGRTIYALDITNPKDFTRANVGNIVKWEFRDPGLGLTYGDPVIARLHSGRWAAIFGNGYNSRQAGARLYIVDMETGQLIRRLEASAPGGGDTAGRNGLASPAVLDLDNDHIADFIYAGDFQGNVWKFDLTSTDPSAWRNPAQPLFRAVSANGDPQPITTAPVAIPHPYGSTYGAMVYVGTGQDVLSIDDQARGANSVYGVWDPAVFSTSDNVVSPSARNNWSVSRDQLLEQSLRETQDRRSLQFRIVTRHPIRFGTSADNTYRGWRFDLPGDGEAILTRPIAALRTSRLEFTTTIKGRNACSITRSGFVMALDLASGGSPDTNVFDVNGDGVINADDNLQLGNGERATASGVALSGGSAGTLARLSDRSTNTVRLIGGSTSGGDVNILLSDVQSSGRRSWREIRE
ncbi:pilus assembly protein [Salinisphaera sp. Q1T1-3]|uniref:pilus assembly protein n=1 Tax=Salinisphaera sp. Q1T1-3 TaxID=2321229 RepID=UPI000E727EEE|nr:PilC/PilY family type IV pilus protein [Salinisphaera sp. Q1T1-3]RJS95351.1 hypothetical protein D3260_02065 [Salinisphaera sp. Q1T1-3]